MFRRAANLLNSVADVLDDMLASDFEFEVQELGELECSFDAHVEPASSAFATGDGGADPELREDSWPATPGTCAGASRRRRPASLPPSPPRRPGSVPRPVEYCLTPLERDRRRADGPDSVPDR